MGRLIDSDVAIEHLGKELRGDAYARAYTAIDKTPTAQQWIPCTSTKRPKNREEVMVTIDNGYQRYTDTDEFVNGQYWYHDNKQVVAWKPFDEPWKEEQP